MNNEKRLVLIGPIAPPYCGGPAVKNRVLAQALEEQGVSVVSVNTLDWRRGFFGLLSSVVSECLRTGRVFLCISTKGRLAFLPLLQLLSLFRPLRVVLMPTGGLFADELSRLPGPIRRLYLAWCGRCTLVLVETQRLARQLQELGLTNVQALPNFKPQWTGAAARRSVQGDPVSILFLSRVRPEKGIELLFQALDALWARGMRFQLGVYGSLQDDYKSALAQQLAQRPYARYGGLLTGSQLMQEISTYDMMVFPTVCNTEGFPAVLIDAAIAGLPVVATDWLANSEVVHDGYNGLLVRPGDVEDLAAKIALLIEDGNLRRQLGENNRRVSENYTAHTVIGRLLKQLDGVHWWQ